MLRLSRPCRFKFSKNTLPEDFGEYSVVLPPEPFVFGTAHIKPRPVPAHIQRPLYTATDDSRIALGTHDEVRMREAGVLARKVREYARSLVQVGVTTLDIDSAIHDFIVKHGAYPAPLLYQGFPRSCCTRSIIKNPSPNESSQLNLFPSKRQ